MLIEAFWNVGCLTLNYSSGDDELGITFRTFDKVIRIGSTVSEEWK
jgi:hypothetical protein